MLIIKDWKARRIVLANGGQVAVGPVVTDDEENESLLGAAVRARRRGDGALRVEQGGCRRARGAAHRSDRRRGVAYGRAI
jgi:hypothetical protein